MAIKRDPKRESITGPIDRNGTKSTLTAVSRSIYGLLKIDVLLSRKQGRGPCHFDQVYVVMNAAGLCGRNVLQSRANIFFFCFSLVKSQPRRLRAEELKFETQTHTKILSLHK